MRDGIPYHTHTPTPYDVTILVPPVAATKPLVYCGKPAFSEKFTNTFFQMHVTHNK